MLAECLIKKISQLLLGFLAVFYQTLAAGQTWVRTDWPLQRGFIAPPMVTQSNFRENFAITGQKDRELNNYCKKLEKKMAEYSWAVLPCQDVNWQFDIVSHNRHPLLYAVFGRGENTTLILSAVHPDELTPIPIGFQFAQYLTSHPDIFKHNDMRIVIAPLVNPDGFLREKPQRTNGRGVDLNRNFLTNDWYKSATAQWKKNKKKATRYFPGYLPNSEIETLFQIKMIEDYHPDKILSLHAPLGFLDYDGPGDLALKYSSKKEEDAQELMGLIASNVKNHKVVNFNYYPGSLGNFAGKERGIPTITIEMQTSNPKEHLLLWSQIFPGIKTTINYHFSQKSLQARSWPNYSFLFD